MAAVKNKPTAVINITTKIFLPEFSRSPGQSESYQNNTGQYFIAKKGRSYQLKKKKYLIVKRSFKC